MQARPLGLLPAKNQQEDRWEFLIPFCSPADFCFSVIFRFPYLQDLLYQEMLTT